jgi:predicted transcriptional regulator
MIAKRSENKYKILQTLKSAELTISDIQFYSGLKRLEIVPVLQDLLRWNEVFLVGEGKNPKTKRKQIL